MERIASNELPNERINISYPIMTIMNRELNLATNVFGVRMSKKSSNQSSEIDFVKMIMLQFHAELPKPYTKQHAADYEMSIVNYFYKFVSN